MARDRLTAPDIKGAWAIMPTPAKANASGPDATDTVDLDEAARIADGLVKAGVDGIFSLGTFGEAATLLWEEKRAFMATVVETIAGRVPFFAGSTTLGTRQTVQEMRAARDIGADGTMLGVPMWCEVDTPTAVQFYRDVTEAVPELAISIYANPEAFKFDFPRPFWAQVADIPQVVCSKYLGIAALVTDLRLVGDRVKLMVSDSNAYAASRIDPKHCDAFWATGTVCGPLVATRLRDTLNVGRTTGDWEPGRKAAEDLAAANRTLFPHGSFPEFAKYNIALERARMNAAGWTNAGPVRAPYHVAPEPYLEGARQAGRAWAALADRYAAE